MSADARLEWVATARNRAPIEDRLALLLRAGDRVLEIASGSGEHCVYFAEHHADVQFQPSDPELEHRASIDAWVRHLGLANVRPALALDVTHDDWASDVAAPAPSLIYCANMIHIAPWAAALGLLRGAGQLLAHGGRLVLYGPYVEAEVATAASNLAFDENLRGRDPEWGLRALEDVAAEARANGLVLVSRHAMPANNLFVVFERAQP